MRREVYDKIEGEVRKHPGVGWWVEDKGKHLKVVLSLAGVKRFVVVSRTASDRRATLNIVADVRRTIRELVPV